MGYDPPRTMFEKIWQAHEIVSERGEPSLIWIDRHFVHEGSFHGFAMLDSAGRLVYRPDLTFAVADHYVPSRANLAVDAEGSGLIDLLRRNALRHGVEYWGPQDPRQGIVHVTAPEQGLALPGLTIVCGDSHTATQGAFGALAFGIGASEVSHALATQTLWQHRPLTMRIWLDGRLGAHVTAKDLILAVIGRIGAAGASGHVIEYAGPAIRALDMESRMTICNMSIEAGSRAGMVAPDDTTFDWLAGRPQVPSGLAWELALRDWRNLPGDDGARFDREVVLDAGAIEPHVTWGTSPETALPVTSSVPLGASAQIREQLEYMGIQGGRPLVGLAIDRVFIGSCTNARLNDLRAAAAVLRGRVAKVPGLVVPGSRAVRNAAEAEGLDRVFQAAGLAWGEPGCSSCVGMNGDLVLPGERCAATSNRNFRGRQGPGARTHLMSPAMVAAAAVSGTIADVRQMAS